MLRFEIMA